MKRIAFFIINVVFYLLVQAQIPGAPKNLLSPNAASLGQYGEIPVSLYTGTPNINIPLYEMTYGDMSVPISLSYHASGIRPDQHPGWVGLGWNLNAGGMISRVIKGIPDDDRVYNTNAWVEYGYYFTHGNLNVENWSNTRMNDIAACTNGMTTNTDSQPDEFSFNFLNYSGKFYYDAKGFWKVQSDSPIKVELIGFSNMPVFNEVEKQHHPQHFSGFTITDEYGNKYVFGNDNIEYSLDFFHQTTAWWHATSWLLTSIELYNGEKINFKYERGPFVNQLYCSYSAVFGIYNSNNGSTIYSSSSSPTLTNGGELISPMYLTTIESPNDKVAFNRSYTKELQYDSTYYFTSYIGTIPYGRYPETPYLNGRFGTADNFSGYNTLYKISQFMQWQQLDGISVFNKNDDERKSYQLLYSSNKKQRLTLQKLLERSTVNGDKINTYIFDYYGINQLPGYLSFQTDHWGYYNGKYSIVTTNSWMSYSGKYTYLYPINFDVDKYYLKREPTTNADTLSFGSLKRIIYPTGGATQFVYEPHDYQTELSLNRWDNVVDTKKNNIAGGLRIKKIINYTNNINDTLSKITKEYFYKKNYNVSGVSSGSSGVLGGRICYNFSNYKVKAFNEPNLTYIKNTFSSQSILPACENTTGAHVGYSEVVEKLPNSGYTRYIFTNFDNGYKDEKYVNAINENLSPYQPCNNRNLERGKMISRSTYDINGSLKSKTTINYQRINPDTNFVKAVYARYEYVSPGSTIYCIDGTAYKKYTYSLLPINRTDSIYEAGGNSPLTKYTSFQYNSNKLISKQITCDSKGDSIITRFKYSGDVGFDSNVTPSSQDVVFSTLKFMKDKNMLAYPVEATNARKKAGVGEKEWVNSSKLQLYKKIKPTYAPNDFCKLYSESELAITTPIQDITDFKGINLYLTSTNSSCNFDSRYIEKLRFNNYDAHGNPISVTKNGVQNNVYLWSYNYRYPIAEIKNATWEEVTRYITELQISDLSRKYLPDEFDLGLIDNLKTNQTTTLVSTYAFEPLIGLTTATSPRGVLTQYSYDNANRLSMISDNKKNVLSQYQYGYVDISESTFQKSSLALNATIFKSSKKFYVGDVDIANIGVIGGSGNYTYNWKLMTGSGAILASQLNSSSTAFSYSYSQVGSMIIQCIVKDNQTNASYTAIAIRTVYK